jgi:MFS transporter, DHA1 family, multidrug resistance protein
MASKSRSSAVSDADHQQLGALRFYLVIASLTTLGPFSLDMYLPGMPALARELRATESTTQLTLSACLIGLGVGQLVAGPLSDAVGRRKPLVVGLITYVVVSLACAAMPAMGPLILLRLLQGTASGAVAVVATALVRDRYSGTAAARFFSLLILVTLLSPLLAPVFGGELLLVTSWRGVFVVLALLGIFLLIVSFFSVRDTLAVGVRHKPGAADTVRGIGRLATDRVFMGYALPGALATGAIFAYLAASSFVLQQVYGVTPQAYGYLFGLNGIALGVSSQANRWLLGFISSEKLFVAGLGGLVAGGLALIACIQLGVLGFFAVVGPVMVIIACNGFVGPNATALALTPHPNEAGTAASLLGSMRFAIGGIAGPFVGLFGSKSALPLALVMCGLTLLAAMTSLASRPSTLQSLTPQ